MEKNPAIQKRSLIHSQFAYFKFPHQYELRPMGPILFAILLGISSAFQRCLGFVIWLGHADSKWENLGVSFLVHPLESSRTKCLFILETGAIFFYAKLKLQYNNLIINDFFHHKLFIWVLLCCSSYTLQLMLKAILSVYPVGPSECRVLVRTSH